MMKYALGAMLALVLCTRPANASTSEPRRYLATMEGFSDAPVEQFGVRRDAVILNGWRFGGGLGYTYEDFITLTEDLCIEYVYHVLNRLEWSIATANAFQGVVILDIEGEVNGHLIHNFGPDPELQPEAFRELAEAIAMRVRVAKQLFPNAEIGYWQLGYVTGNGIPFEGNIEYLQGLAALGAYDQVDYAVTQQYPIGCPGASYCNGVEFSIAERYAQRALGAVLTARSITDSQGRPFKVMPILQGMLLGQGGCPSNPDLGCVGEEVLFVDGAEHGEPALNDTLGVQMTVFRLLGVEAVAFWEPGIFPPATPEAYFDALYKLGDYTADCAVDISDLIHFLDLYANEDPGADLTAPFGVPDLTDLLAFLGLVGTNCEF